MVITLKSSQITAKGLCLSLAWLLRGRGKCKTVKPSQCGGCVKTMVAGYLKGHGIEASEP